MEGHQESIAVADMCGRTTPSRPPSSPSPSPCPFKPWGRGASWAASPPAKSPGSMCSRRSIWWRGWRAPGAGLQPAGTARLAAAAGRKLESTGGAWLD